jgi:hypothetical protein
MHEIRSRSADAAPTGGRQCPASHGTNASDLPAIERALGRHWSIDTCDPVDIDDWSEANPARGQCGATALVLQKILGGDLLVAEVTFDNGGRQGFHYWNRLPNDQEVDLTREQFAAHEHVQQPVTAERPTRRPRRAPERYETLRHAVMLDLALTDGDLALAFAERALNAESRSRSPK